ncbi:hypothetical protein [Erythrobacter sp. A6_0]|uniref:hypothetical protein n=1 Tax=Erythrobacter sp. A6_0 TaxID=2821089 RepID=UPI001ADAE800|nr:hypothetical protein [Erythrobacter sp. A6_0]MBO9510920.1 hypothetical protein [Erythrobacter sp. A6_0]
MMQTKIEREAFSIDEEAFLAAMLAVPQLYGSDLAKRARGALKSAIEWMEAGTPIRTEDRDTLEAEIAAAFPTVCATCPMVRTSIKK